MAQARAFEFVPFGVMAREGSLACDGLVDGPTLHLSHWSGNKTAPEFKADTSVEIAMRFAETHRDDASALVVNNHYDTDGVLAVFSLVDPDCAMAHRELLIAAAEAGDFEEWPALEKGLWLDAALRKLGSASGGDANAYASVLPVIPELLDTIEQREDLWRTEWDTLLSARDQADAGGLVVEQIGPIAIFQHARGVGEFPGPVLSRRAPQGCTRWLLAFDKGDGTFEYRYERPRWAWADTVNRPRISSPSRNALVQDLGPGWAIKGALGMTGLARTLAPVTMQARAVAEAIARRDVAAQG